MTDETLTVKLTPDEIEEMLRLANLGTTARKLVDALLEDRKRQVLWLETELDHMPVETTIRMGYKGKQRVRVKSCDGRWVGAGKESYSALSSAEVIKWYSRVEVLHVGDGWNP